MPTLSRLRPPRPHRMRHVGGEARVEGHVVPAVGVLLREEGMSQ